MKTQTAVTKGHDFAHKEVRYQVKGNRPSGRQGSQVTLVGKASNYDWDQLIWILYNPIFEIQEAWLWEVNDYKREFSSVSLLRPNHMRKGKKIK